MIEGISHIATVATLCFHHGPLPVLQSALTGAHCALMPFQSVDDFLACLKHKDFACAVLELMAPRHGSGDLVRQLKTLSYGIPLIVVSDRCDISTAVEFMKAGAADVIVGTPDSEPVATAVRAVVAQSAPKSPSAAPAPISKVSPREAAERVARLTPRERDVVEYVTHGYHNREIAGILGISTRTAETYRKSAMTKLRASTVCELVRLVAGLDPWGGNARKPAGGPAPEPKQPATSKQNAA